MRLIIEVAMDCSALEYDGELSRILATVEDKVNEQFQRPACICDAPEAADQLRDMWGNVVGSVRLIDE